MAPTPPLPVTEDTPPDMLAGSMDLRVVLPGGHAVKMSVERSTPMMDLLVQVTTANKIAPGGHVLQAVGERGILPYKPSTPIGALDTWTIQIVPKVRTFSTSSLKKAPLKPSNQQPFEQTFRLQVHLPRNQLFVARVSPKTLLSDILHQACTEKNLDPSKYELRHPANLEERLRADYTLADYKLQEVTLVSKGGRPLGAGLSSSDIMALQKEEEKRRQQARAGGGTGSAVLGLMFNKRNRSSICDGSISSDSLGGRSISPARSDETPSPPGSSLPPPRPARKRRPAPKPPIQQAAVISHSRNSSDSSGYHEASVLSESPESNGLGPDGTLPRRSKLTSAAPSQPTSNNPSSNLSRSLSNLTSVSSNMNNKMATQASDNMKSCQHSVSTSSLASGKKKKAAPPPPQVVNSAKTTTTIAEEMRMQAQRTASLSTLSSQSSLDSYEREVSLKGSSLERNPAEKTASLPTPTKHKEVIENKAGLQRKKSPKSSLERQTNVDTVVPVTKAILARTDNTCSENSAIDVHSQLSSESLSDLSSGKSTPERLSKGRSQCSLESQSELSSGKSTPDRQIGHGELSSAEFSSKKQGQVNSNIENSRGQRTESPQATIYVNNHIVEANIHEKPTSISISEAEPKVLAQQLQNLPVGSIKVDPNVLLLETQSGVASVPTPKPRVYTAPASAKPSPVPCPRLTSCSAERVPGPVPQDNDTDSLDTKYGSIGRTFGVGTTLVMLAAASTGSTSSSEWKGSLGAHSDFSNQFSDVDVNSLHSDVHENDEEDALDISENDLEMFEVKTLSAATSDGMDSGRGTTPERAGVYDDTASVSVASSAFDSDNDGSDGSWGRRRNRSNDLKMGHFLIRRSFNKGHGSSSKLRAGSLNSLEEVPAFLGGGRMGRWDNSETLHEGLDPDLEAETEEVQRAFQNMTEELEAAICADEGKKTSPLPAPPSPGLGSASPSIADWEYQLPAPPTAFRDLNDSPTPTHGETVVLADTTVFEESALSMVGQSSPLEHTDITAPPLDFHSLPVEHTRLSFHEDLAENVTKTNPMFDAQKFEEEIVRQQSNEVKERLNRVRETNASLRNETLDDNDDDWKPQLLSEETLPQPDVELRNSRNIPSHKSSSNDYNQSNQLKNFTITTYQRPREMDAIFDGESESGNKVHSDFKKPVPTSVYNKQRSSKNSQTPSNLPRTNSFNANNNESSEYPSVKRSTSYISLVNSGRNIRTKSIGNVTATASEGEKESNPRETHAVDNHARLRKTTSEVNISQGVQDNQRLTELQDQFLQWQEKILRQTEPNLPLQSLQVLRSILNPIAAPGQEQVTTPVPVQEQVANVVQERVAAHPPVQERVSVPDKAEQTLSRNDTHPRLAQSADSINAVAPQKQTTTTTTLDRRLNAPNEPSKRYSYQGPPAVNFATWSERPKSQVSIKVDSDYRIGKGQGCSGMQPPNQEHQQASGAKSEMETVDEVDSISTPTSTEDIKSVKNQTMKLEQTPLTMRIISHTTASGYKRTPFSNSRINFVSKNEETAPQSNSKETKAAYQGSRVAGYNSAQIADPSRVPIVRAVELKKSFAQGVNVEKNANNSSTQLNWDELDQGRNKQTNTNSENDPPETYKGVNSLAKRFSVASSSRDNVRVGFRAPSARPVSAYLYNGSNETSEPSDLKQNSVSTSNLQNVGAGDSYGASTVNHTNGARKYTSVVGINGAGLSGSNYREPAEVNRVNSRITNSASIKVNGFSAPKHPMPVVKGFRFASSGTNHSDATLVAEAQKPVTNVEPLTVKVQRTNSYANQNQRSTVVESVPSFNVRIQHMPVAKVDSSVVRVQQLAAPVPPPAPVMRTVASQPKSFSAPQVNPRDQLMDAIRSFGGRNNLRQSGGS